CDGTRSLRNGQMIRSGRAARTAPTMSCGRPARCTPTSWLASRSAHHARRVRPLNADTSNRIRIADLPRTSCPTHWESWVDIYTYAGPAVRRQLDAVCRCLGLSLATQTPRLTDARGYSTCFL